MSFAPATATYLITDAPEVVALDPERLGDGHIHEESGHHVRLVAAGLLILPVGVDVVAELFVVAVIRHRIIASAQLEGLHLICHFDRADPGQFPHRPLPSLRQADHHHRHRVLHEEVQRLKRKDREERLRDYSQIVVSEDGEGRATFRTQDGRGQGRRSSSRCRRTDGCP